MGGDPGTLNTGAISTTVSVYKDTSLAFVWNKGAKILDNAAGEEIKFWNFST